MRTVLLGASALALCAFASATAAAEDLEILDPQIAQAFAQALLEVADKVEKPQVKIEGDVEKACGVHLDQVGLIIVPQKDMTPDNDKVNSDPGTPVAHLFMSHVFTPIIDGKPVDPKKIRTLTFSGQDGNDHKVNYLILAARHTDDDQWHLYAYGSDEKPLIDAAIGEGTGPGTQPLALEVKDLDKNEATAYLTFFDQFQCNFKISHKPD